MNSFSLGLCPEILAFSASLNSLLTAMLLTRLHMWSFSVIQLGSYLQRNKQANWFLSVVTALNYLLIPIFHPVFLRCVMILPSSIFSQREVFHCFAPSPRGSHGNVLEHWNIALYFHQHSVSSFILSTSLSLCSKLWHVLISLTYHMSFLYPPLPATFTRMKAL